MTKFHLGLVAGAVALALAAPGQVQSAGGSEKGIDQCRNIADASERLDCYDRLAEPDVVTHAAPKKPDASSLGAAVESESESESADAEPDSSNTEFSEIASHEPEDSVLADEIGLSKPADAYRPIPVMVARCGQAKNHKWYFYLDNGQVWQYLGARTLRYRKCEKPGNLIEDHLGFSLQMNGDTAKLRVKRVR